MSHRASLSAAALEAEAPLRVEVWADIQCIWCYISSARLRIAIAQFDGAIDLRYRSFELSPNAPIEIDREAHISSHGMAPARMAKIRNELTRQTSALGLSYRPDLTQPTNSHRALQLLHFAADYDARARLTERLFSAYFSEGRPIARIDELVSFASDVGLDAPAARSALTDRRYRDAVDADVARARSLGARGVPFIVIDQRFSIAGAQPVEQLLSALREAHRHRGGDGS